MIKIVLRGDLDAFLGCGTRTLNYPQLRSCQVPCVESIDECNEELTFAHRVTAKVIAGTLQRWGSGRPRRPRFNAVEQVGATLPIPIYNRTLSFLCDFLKIFI